MVDVLSLSVWTTVRLTRPLLQYGGFIVQSAEGQWEQGLVAHATVVIGTGGPQIVTVNQLCYEG